MNLYYLKRKFCSFVKPLSFFFSTHFLHAFSFLKPPASIYYFSQFSSFLISRTLLSRTYGTAAAAAISYLGLLTPTVGRAAAASPNSTSSRPQTTRPPPPHLQPRPLHDHRRDGRSRRIISNLGLLTPINRTAAAAGSRSCYPRSPTAYPSPTAARSPTPAPLPPAPSPLVDGGPAQAHRTSTIPSGRRDPLARIR